MATESTNKTSKIGIVDVQFLINNTPSVLALRQEQQKNTAELQEWVNKANAEIAKLAKKEEKDNLAQKYRLELTQRQQMLQLEYNQKVQGIDVELTKLIADVAKKEHFDYLLHHFH